MSVPFVVACCPAKDRAWALPRWYQALYGQSEQPDAMFVLLNDCHDGSGRLLEAMSFLSGDRWDNIKPQLAYETFDTGDGGSDRVEPRYSIENLVVVRNELISRVLRKYPQCSHVLTVDSDVCPAPNVLELLLAAELPVVSAVVRNSPAIGVTNYWVDVRDGQPARSPCGQREIAVLSETTPQLVTMTGSCVLLNRRVWDDGVRYGFHPSGEDVFWSIEAQRGGYFLAVHPQARTRHLQKNGEEWR